MTRHALLARLDNAGDVLLAGPAVRAVAGGGTRVTMWCGHGGQAAARLLPGVADVVVHAAGWIDADPAPIDRRATDAFVADLGGRDIDEAFVLTSFHQSPLPAALLLRMAGVPAVAAISEDYPGSLLDVRHRVGDCHEVERALSLVATGGYALPDDDDGRLAIAPIGRWPEEPFDVVVHPGASVPARTWDAPAWAAVVSAVLATGRTVAVTGGPSERALTASVAGAARDLGGTTDLATLAALLAAAGAVITGNTGPAHLAAAVGTPVVSVFPPTVSATRWRPWRVPHELFGWQDIGCAGCRARVCPLAAQACLAGIKVDDVVAAVIRLSTAPAEAAA